MTYSFYSDIDKSLCILKQRMMDDNYHIAPPLNQKMLDSLMQETPPEGWSEVKQGVYKDIKKLFEDRVDVKYFYLKLDGFTYNAGTIYNISQTINGQLSGTNIYLSNFYYRDNEEFVDPDLVEHIVIGEDSMSYFVYNTEDKSFEVRDRLVNYLIEKYDHFNDLLKYIIKTTTF